MLKRAAAPEVNRRRGSSFEEAAERVPVVRSEPGKRAAEEEQRHHPPICHLGTQVAKDLNEPGDHRRDEDPNDGQPDDADHSIVSGRHGGTIRDEAEAALSVATFGG
jgi:hypothetical protein